jgi:peroxiredoxin Q/BCP
LRNPFLELLVRRVILAGALSLAAVSVAAAQNKMEPLGPKLAVGTDAPDFTLSGATKEGLLAKPANLKDYRGQTVVLAFFFRARTKG